MVLLLNQPSEESKLFRLTFRHSFFMASAIGLLVTIYVYVVPAFVRCGGRIRQCNVSVHAPTHNVPVHADQT
jgi:hypothetical protein